MVGLEAEADREHLHQLDGHRAEAVEELVDARLEAGQHVLGEPLVGPVEAQVRRLASGGYGGFSVETSSCSR